MFSKRVGFRKHFQSTFMIILIFLLNFLIINPIIFLHLNNLQLIAMNTGLHISERGKRRLKLAAMFLRARNFKFDGDNFYDMVIKTIYDLHQMDQKSLKELVDWAEVYEVAEIELLSCEHAPACLKPQYKSVPTKNGSSSLRLPAPK